MSASESEADLMAPKCNFSSTPENGLKSDIGPCPNQYRKSRGLFDHFGSLREQRRRHSQAEGLGGVEVDDFHSLVGCWTGRPARRVVTTHKPPPDQKSGHIEIWTAGNNSPRTGGSGCGLRASSLTSGGRPPTKIIPPFTVFSSSSVSSQLFPAVFRFRFTIIFLDCDAALCGSHQRNYETPHEK